MGTNMLDASLAPSWRNESRLQGFALSALVIVHFLLVLNPAQLYPMRSGLDQSWIAVLAHAYDAGWQWGEDIVFTYGPLGFVMPRIFYPDLAATTVLMWVFFSFALGIGLLSLLRGLPIALAAVLYLVVAVVAHFSTKSAPYFSANVILMLAPLMLGLGHLKRLAPMPLPVTLLLVGMCAVCALIKGTFLFLVPMFLLVIDIVRAVERRFPFLTGAFIVAFVAVYMLAGQELAELPAYISRSAEVAAGYNEAMAIWGSPYELTLFLVLSFDFGLLVVWLELRQGLHRTDWTIAIGRLILLAIFWFFAYKLGFVRHDLHSLNAWAALSLGGALYMASGPRVSDWPQRVRTLTVAGCLILALLPPTIGLKPALINAATLVQLVLPQPSVTNLWRFLADHAAWKEGWVQAQARALAEIRDETPLPRLEGTVDIIRPIQSAVLAHDLDYVPRPIFQGYSAYTPALIDLNLAHLSGPAAPRYMLVSLRPIDHRLPALEDGAVLLELLRSYRPVTLEHEQVVMERKPDPDAPLKTLSRHEIRLGQSLTLPSGARGVAATIDMPKTLLGKIVTALWKAPRVRIDLTLEDGQVRTYRFIPGMAARPFMLSPLVTSANDFMAIASGASDAPASGRVVGIRLRTSAWGSFFYRQPFSVKFSGFAD